MITAYIFKDLNLYSNKEFKNILIYICYNKCMLTPYNKYTSNNQTPRKGIKANYVNSFMKYIK